MDFIRNDILTQIIILVSFLLMFIYGGFITYKTLTNSKNQNLNYNLNLRLFLLKNCLYLIGILFLLFSYLGPILGINGTLANLSNSDIVFVVDSSKSMDAIDATNEKNISRLDYTKKIISNFVTNESQNNYSLIVFAGKAISISPLTNDTDWFLTNLDSINSDIIKEGGTNISDALKEAIGDTKDSKKKNIVIISDGEDINGDNNYNFLKETKDKIKIFTIGVGSEKGDYIPTGNDFLGNPTFKSFEGEKVVTKLNEDSLIKIANIGNGTYSKGDSTDVLYGIKNKFIINNSLNSEILKKEYDNGYYFVVISFIFLLVGYLIRDKRALGKK